MNYWLIKTEPNCYSFDDLVREKRTRWDGVTNNGAPKCMREVKKGDRAFVYNTGTDKRIAGTAEVVKAPYPDPEADDDKIVVFDVKPLKPLKKPVTLAEIKKDKRFADFELVKFSRLAVMPVSPERWDLLLTLGQSAPQS